MNSYYSRKYSSTLRNRCASTDSNTEIIRNSSTCTDVVVVYGFTGGCTDSTIDSEILQYHPCMWHWRSLCRRYYVQVHVVLQTAVKCLAYIPYTAETHRYTNRQVYKMNSPSKILPVRGVGGFTHMPLLHHSNPAATALHLQASLAWPYHLEVLFAVLRLFVLCLRFKRHFPVLLE